ncbi:MAG: hypothetical protein NC819_00185 [Candidatus Omnitrophica bacterium]|nr:hypothetical protein [Candidatus Omnitrophota bacterium]
MKRSLWAVVLLIGFCMAGSGCASAHKHHKEGDGCCPPNAKTAEAAPKAGASCCAPKTAK